MHKWATYFTGTSAVINHQVIDIKRRDIDIYDGRVIVDYRLVINANPSKVTVLLQDVNQFSQLSNLISHSTIINHSPKQRSQELKPCFLGICYTLQKTETLSQNDDGSVVAVIVPNAGDFRSGFERWQADKTDTGTQLSYHADLTPTMPIPPFIGLVLIRKMIHHELITIAKKITERCG